jgi:hypothetical protein
MIKMRIIYLEWTFRKIRKVLSVNPLKASESPFYRQTRAFYLSLPIIRAIYAISLLFLMERYRSFNDRLPQEMLSPPIAFWFDFFTPEQIARGVSIIAMLVITLATIWPNIRLFRLLSAISGIYFVAALTAFGVLIYPWYIWLYCLIGLVFLPNIGAWNNLSAVKRRERQKFLLIIWFLTAILLATYFFSAFWKIYIGTIGLSLKGRPSLLDASALASQIANYNLKLWLDPPGASLIIQSKIASFAMMWSTIYFQITAPIILFRPSLYFIWGIYLLLFHILGIYFLDVHFRFHVVLVALLLVGSPIASHRLCWRDNISYLPGVALINLLLRRTQK